MGIAPTTPEGCVPILLLRLTSESAQNLYTNRTLGLFPRIAKQIGFGADAEGARARALAAYKHFLMLRKDADADIPILKQARAEYTKLQ